MQHRRRLILIGMISAAVLAVFLVIFGSRWTNTQTLTQALALAFFGPGLVYLALMGRLAAIRFFDDRLIDGQTFPTDSPAELTNRVLSNTTEQLVLSAVLWPFIGTQCGTGLVVILGINLAVMRLIFWAGYAISPPLRAFGFAGGFYPTIVATIISLFKLI